jgi:hypothetical protein
MVKWGMPCSQVEFGPYSILFVVNKGLSTKKINIWTLIHYKHFTSTAHCKLLNYTLHSYCSFLIKFSYETLIIAIVHKLSWTPVDKWASKYAMRLSFFWLMTELFCLQYCGHGINKQRSKTLDMTLRAQAFKLYTWEAPYLCGNEKPIDGMKAPKGILRAAATQQCR